MPPLRPRSSQIQSSSKPAASIRGASATTSSVGIASSFMPIEATAASYAAGAPAINGRTVKRSARRCTDGPLAEPDVPGERRREDRQ